MIPSALQGSTGPTDTLSLGLTAQGHGLARGWLFLSGSASQGWNSPRSSSTTFATFCKRRRGAGWGGGKAWARSRGCRCHPLPREAPLSRWRPWGDKTALHGGVRSPASSALWEEVGAMVSQIKLGFRLLPDGLVPVSLTGDPRLTLPLRITLGPELAGGRSSLLSLKPHTTT